MNFYTKFHTRKKQFNLKIKYKIYALIFKKKHETKNK